MEFKLQVLYLRKQSIYKADRGTFLALFVSSWINLSKESLLEFPTGMCNIILNASSLQWCANVTNQPFKQVAFLKALMKNVVLAVSVETKQTFQPDWLLTSVAFSKVPSSSTVLTAFGLGKWR